MVVNYFGEGAFRLQSGDTSILINPTNNRLKADLVLRTLTPTNVLPRPDEIIFPGEYETKDIEIKGYLLDQESNDKYVKTVYSVLWEEMRFVFLGHISKPLPDELEEELGDPDVLFVPTGDAHFISPGDAAKLVKRLEPAIVIPAFYKSANDLLKSLGVKGEHEEKLVFKKKELIDTKGRVVVIEAKA